MGTIPTISTFTAGQVLTAADMNEVKAAVDFWALTPRCMATETAGQSIPNNSDTVVSFPGEVYDVVQSGDSPMHDNTTNNSRVYIRTAGKYSLIGSVSFSSDATGIRRITIRKNGATTLVQTTSTPVSGASTTIQVGPIILDLVAGDYVELLAFQNRGSALSLNASAPGPSFLQATLDAG